MTRRLKVRHVCTVQINMRLAAIGRHHQARQAALTLLEVRSTLNPKS